MKSLSYKASWKQYYPGYTMSNYHLGPDLVVEMSHDNIIQVNRIVALYITHRFIAVFILHTEYLLNNNLCVQTRYPKLLFQVRIIPVRTCLKVQIQNLSPLSWSDHVFSPHAEKKKNRKE